MKNIFLAAALTWVATNANAIVRPIGTEIPTLKAELTEYNVAEGVDWENPNQNQTLTQFERYGAVSSFQFSEDQEVVCKKAPCDPVRTSVHFQVQYVSKDTCGSTTYHGVATRKFNPMFAPRQTIEVVDHSTRLCEDYRPYRWEIKITTLIPTPPPTLAFHHVDRTFVGNPEPVYTIQ